MLRRRPLGIDRHDDALRSKPPGGGTHKFRMFHRRRIDADFIGSCIQESPNIIQRSHASPDRDRHEDLFCGARDDIQDRPTILVRRRDIQKTQLIGAVPIVRRGYFNRVAGIPKIHERYAFNHPAGFDIEARDNPFRQHEFTT
jgi:hypothetical protein